MCLIHIVSYISDVVSRKKLWVVFHPVPSQAYYLSFNEKT